MHIFSKEDDIPVRFCACCVGNETWALEKTNRISTIPPTLRAAVWLSSVSATEKSGSAFWRNFTRPGLSSSSFFQQQKNSRSTFEHYLVRAFLGCVCVSGGSFLGLARSKMVMRKKPRRLTTIRRRRKCATTKTVCFAHRLIDWLIDWVGVACWYDRSIDWLIDWWIGVDWLIDWLGLLRGVT